MNQSLPKDVVIPEDLLDDPVSTYNPRRSIASPDPGMSTSLPTIRALPPQSAERSAAKSVQTVDDLELTEPLAHGGFGDIYLGVQASLERVIAIKRLRRDRLHDLDEDEQRGLARLFHQEALTTANLEHPNIVPVYQLGVDATGSSMIGMKLVRGRPWNELIRSELDRPMAEYLGRHLPILIAVSQAVAFAHSKGVLHRDLKPHQVMVGEFGEVLLMDWGLAAGFPDSDLDRRIGNGGSSSPRVEIAGPPSGAAGTPSFMAPEQTRGKPEQLGPWTDLYLLGGTLYYVLTGSPPHEASDSIAAFVRAAAGEIKPPSERFPERGIPHELETLVLGVLHPDPGCRKPATVRDFIHAIEEYLSGATRQRRSQRLTDEVASCAASLDYSELSRRLSVLREARTLWPENTRAEALHRTTLLTYTEAALAQNDLVLARLHAEQLPTEPVTTDLVGRIDSAVARRRARARQRRFALAGMVILALLLLAGSLQYLSAERKASERLASQRDAARRARADAEGLMTFMLEDLQDSLRSIDRVDLLAPLARRANEYYSNRDPAEMSSAEKANRGVAFSSIRDTLQIQGDIEEAIAAGRQAVAVFDGLLAAEPESLERLLDYLEAVRTVAWALNDFGDQAGALMTYIEVREKAESALETRPGNKDLSWILSATLDGIGIAYYDRGELDRALGAFSRSASVLETLRQVDPSPELDFTLSGIELRRAVTLHDSGRLEAALEAIERSRGLIKEVGRRSPEPQQILTVGFTESIRGDILASLGRHEEGARALRALQPQLHAQVALDPTNAERRYLVANLELTLGELEDALGHHAAAHAAWNRLVELLEPEREQTDHTYLLDVLVRGLLRLNRVDEARPIAIDLLNKGWNHRDFSRLAGRYGIAVEEATTDQK